MTLCDSSEITVKIRKMQFLANKVVAEKIDIWGGALQTYEIIHVTQIRLSGGVLSSLVVLLLGLRCILDPKTNVHIWI